MDAIDTYVRTYPGSPVLLDVLGTAEADAIRAKAFELDPEAARIFAFAASVGASFGIERRDGSRVAMKVHKLFRDERYHDDVQRVQAALADAGFPAPRPLGRRGLVTWEEWLDEGVFRDAHEPPVRRALAGLLVRFVDLATATGVRPSRPFFPDAGEALWPTPHNALFDFEATREGAEWIDEIARAAKPLRDARVGRVVVGHTDWSIKHFRWDDELRATAVYDWDSVDTQTETRIVGTAAASFVYTEEIPGVSKWTTPEETVAFVADYERARGMPFSDEERSAIHGAAVYLAAYGARCTWAYARRANRPQLESMAEALL
ncbi:MAG TPA: phosphotransferase [Gaiellaceae bacterium]